NTTSSPLNLRLNFSEYRISWLSAGLALRVTTSWDAAAAMPTKAIRGRAKFDMDSLSMTDEFARTARASHADWEFGRILGQDMRDLPVKFLNLGEDRGFGNLVGIQPFLTTQSYRNRQEFASTLTATMTAAAEEGLLNPNTVVVFPEY